MVSSRLIRAPGRRSDYMYACLSCARTRTHLAANAISCMYRVYQLLFSRQRIHQDCEFLYVINANVTSSLLNDDQQAAISSTV